MKREKEIPADLLAWIKDKRLSNIRKFKKLNIYCTLPVRVVKMKVQKDDAQHDHFRMVIIPAIDIYTTSESALEEGFLSKDTMSYFVSETHIPLPYGHIYAESGYVCLGSIFVPSAVPEISPAMPIETLFLHNDRNLSHGGASLTISKKQANLIKSIIMDCNIHLSAISHPVIDNPGCNIIAHDEIWNLSADVEEQKSLPSALHIMSDIYNIIFKSESANN